MRSPLAAILVVALIAGVVAGGVAVGRDRHWFSSKSSPSTIPTAGGPNTSSVTMPDGSTIPPAERPAPTTTYRGEAGRFQQCTMVTTAQVSATVGTTVTKDKYPEPTLLGLSGSQVACEWSIPDNTNPGGILPISVVVTFNTSPAAFAASEANALSLGPGGKLGGLGDAAYWADERPNPTVGVLKGATSIEIDSPAIKLGPIESLAKLLVPLLPAGKQGVDPFAAFVADADQVCQRDDLDAQAVTLQVNGPSGQPITTPEQYAQIVAIGERDTKDLEALPVPPKDHSEIEQAIKLQATALASAEKAKDAYVAVNLDLKSKEEDSEAAAEDKSASLFDDIGAIACGTQREGDPTFIW